MDWKGFKVVVVYENGAEKSVTGELPEYLLGEIRSHLNELEALENGELPRFIGEKK